MNCLRITIKGDVQGVGLRAAARQEALLRGLTGYARNKPDGTVEIAACGEYNHLEIFIDFCKNNPGASQVRSVDVLWIDPVTYVGFEIL